MALGYSKILAIAALGAGTAALVPSMTLAFPTSFNGDAISIETRGGLGSFTPASIDPDLASSLKFHALRGDSRFRFTPASVEGAGQRAMTIAVRVRPDAARAINVKPQLSTGVGRASPLAQINQSSYSLGVAKGFQKFALPVSQRSESLIPDLSEMGQGALISGIDGDKDGKKSRFRPRIELDSPSPGGNRTRAFDDQGSYSVDVGGSYKLTRNLDVMAGIRLKSDRDRLGSLTDEQYDSQAVFVGTEFRF